jgi:Zn-dependent peptidase ImmA (M78 family)/DNA-binding XRE family transcriptional regulator
VFTPARLAVARKRRGLTLTRLAEMVGVTPQTLSNVERGRYAPSDATLEALSAALDFPISFFSKSDPPEVLAEQVSFRARTKTSARTRDAALSAAAIAVELHTWIDSRFELPKTEVPTLDGTLSPEMAAEHVRARWGLNRLAGIANMVHLLEAHGVAVYSLPPEYVDVDAFSFWLDGKPFIFLNTLKSAERGRFDAAHELGHLVLHAQSLGGQKARADEREADVFASSFLMPAESVHRIVNYSPTVDEIVRFKHRWRVSAMALAYRLHELGIISDWGYRRAVIDLGEMGFRSDEPGGINRETSHILRKVLNSLRSRGFSYSMISRELHISTVELNEIMFNLAVVPLASVHASEESGEVPAPRSRSLRIVL